MTGSVCAVTPRRVGGHDDETDARPSPEAQRALEEARRAQVGSSAVLPVAERARDEVRRALAADHFTALMRDVLREAARRSVGS